MKAETNSLTAAARRVLSSFDIAMLSVVCLAHHLAGRATANRDGGIPGVALSTEPWTDAQRVKPAELVKEIADAKDGNRPVVVCSGVRVLL